MPISHKNKLIFIHIPKTGGSSIEKALGIYGSKNKGDNRGVNYSILFGENIQHLTLPDLIEKNFITPHEFKNYYKFTIIRNPWDRMVSEYFDRIIRYNTRMKFEEFLRIHLNGAYRLDPHFLPQNKFIRDRNNNVLVDQIIRFENLHKEIPGLFSKLKIYSVGLPFINATHHHHYSEYYMQTTQDMVYQYFEDDVKQFGYKFETTCAYKNYSMGVIKHFQRLSATIASIIP